MRWQSLLVELDRWREAGITARLWLRDDDAIRPTPLLDELAALTARFRVPVALSIIPADTDETLARYLLDVPHMSPAVHGWSHANHAPASEKKQELGLHRDREAILGELARAFRRMSDLHGERLVPMLVPPWNRIAPELMADLPALGYRALSTFDQPVLDVAHLTIINTHVDLIDFRGTRRCHDHDLLAQRVAEELLRSRLLDRSAVGILSHHLLGDKQALHFLNDLFSVTTNHPACRWMEADELIG
jgi:hypothetical protein